jgi:anti-sigma-K factor RskA
MKHSDPLVQKIKHTLDQQTLDTDTTRQLAQARQKALQQSQPFWRMSYAVPAMVMASLMAIVVMINQQLPDQSPSFAADSIDTFEILSSKDELEMYENLEFYVWLDEQEIDQS